MLDLVGSTQRIQLRDAERVQTVADRVLAANTCIFSSTTATGFLRCAADQLKVAFGAHDTPCTREIDAQPSVVGFEAALEALLPKRMQRRRQPLLHRKTGGAAADPGRDQQRKWQ